MNSTTLKSAKTSWRTCTKEMISEVVVLKMYLTNPLSRNNKENHILDVITGPASKTYQIMVYEFEKLISPIRQHDLSEQPVINLCQRAHTELAFPFHRKDSSRHNQCIIHRYTSRETPYAEFQVHRPQKILFLQLNQSNPLIGRSNALIDSHTKEKKLRKSCTIEFHQIKWSKPLTEAHK